MRLRDVTAHFDMLTGESAVVLLTGAMVEAIQVPPTFDGESQVSFVGSRTGLAGTFYPIQDFLGAPIVISARPGWTTQLPIGAIRGHSYLRVIAGADPSSPGVVDVAVNLTLLVRDYE